MSFKSANATAQSPTMMSGAVKTGKSDLGWRDFFEKLAADGATDTRQALPKNVQE